jgi:uncharacterized membrane protein
MLGALFGDVTSVLPVIVLYLIIGRAVSGVAEAAERNVARRGRSRTNAARGEICRDEYERVRRGLETG